MPTEKELYEQFKAEENQQSPTEEELYRQFKAEEAAQTPGAKEVKSLPRQLAESTAATVQGGLQGFTAGIYNPYSAAVQAPIRAFQNAGLSGVASLDELAKGYNQARAEQKGLEKQYPVASTGAEIAASFMPQSLAMKGAGIVTKGISGLTQGYKKGAIESASQAAIGSVSDPENALENVGIATVLGAPLGKLTQKLSGAKGKAAELAVQAGGAQGKKYQKALGQIQAGKDAGNILLERGLVKAGDEVKDVHQRVKEVLPKIGQELSDAYEEVKNTISKVDLNKYPHLANDLKAARIDPAQITNDILAKAHDKLKNPSGNLSQEHQALFDKIRNTLEDFSNSPDMDVKQLHDWRMYFDKQIKSWNTGNRDQFGKVVSENIDSALKNIRSSMNDSIENTFNAASNIAKQVGGTSKNAAQLKKLNKDYSALTNMQSIGRDRLEQIAANNKMSLRDTMSAIGIGGPALATMGIEGLALGAGAGLASKVIRERGDATAARGLELLSKLRTEKIPLSKISGVSTSVINRKKENKK